MSPDSVLNIVVPMAGRGSRFAAVGFTDPKPLIPLGGRPMIQWVIDNIRPNRPHRFLFSCLAEHLEPYPALKPRLQEICPGCVVIPVDCVTEGAACTVLLAREHLNSDAPLMIANSDQFYLAPAYNLLIEQGARILTVATGREGAGMHGLGTPEDFRLFQETAVFRSRSTSAPSRPVP